MPLKNLEDLEIKCMTEFKQDNRIQKIML